jgi:hypothetical protein
VNVYSPQSCVGWCGAPRHVASARQPSQALPRCFRSSSRSFCLTEESRRHEDEATTIDAHDTGDDVRWSHPTIHVNASVSVRTPSTDRNSLVSPSRRHARGGTHSGATSSHVTTAPRRRVTGRCSFSAHSMCMAQIVTTSRTFEQLLLVESPRHAAVPTLWPPISPHLPPPCRTPPRWTTTCSHPSPRSPRRVALLLLRRWTSSPLVWLASAPGWCGGRCSWTRCS